MASSATQTPTILKVFPLPARMDMITQDPGVMSSLDTLPFPLTWHRTFPLLALHDNRDAVNDGHHMHGSVHKEVMEGL